MLMLLNIKASCLTSVNGNFEELILDANAMMTCILILVHMHLCNLVPQYLLFFVLAKTCLADIESKKY